MSVYNGERYVSKAIDSILQQTYTDFEFIIINDGSTDATEEIIRRYKDPRIVYLHQENLGLITSLNVGIEKSGGEYIARMDADDIAAPDRLEKQIGVCLKNPDYAVVGSYAIIIDEVGVAKGTMTYPPCTWQKIRTFSLLHNPFIHSSIMYKKTVVKAVGGYRASFKHIEDYELWTRIIHTYPCANIPELLLQYRTHGMQVTRTKKWHIRLRGIFLRIINLYRYLAIR
jgi:glycosyltransferase involved in cell wall biosynthesis